MRRNDDTLSMPYELINLVELHNRIYALQFNGMLCVRDCSEKPAMTSSRRQMACGLAAKSPTPLEARVVSKKVCIGFLS
jgi:hypothetical protein